MFRHHHMADTKWRKVKMPNINVNIPKTGGINTVDRVVDYVCIQVQIILSSDRISL
jgi:hypothetical protein